MASRKEILDLASQGIPKDILADPEAASELARSIINSAPICADRDARRSAAEVLCLLVAQNSEVGIQVTQALEEVLQAEANSKSARASSDEGTLFFLCCALLSAGNSAPSKEMLSSFAIIMHRLLTAPKVRPALAKSAPNWSQAALLKTARKFSTSAITVDFTIGEPALWLDACIAGAAASAHNDGASPALEAIAEANTQEWLDLFCKTVLQSKQIVSGLALEALGPAVALLSQSQLDDVLAPALNRAILRSPEQILGTVVPSVVALFNDGISVNVLLKTLRSSILSNVSSSNPQIRRDASNALCCLVSRASPQPESNESIKDICDKLVKATVSEHRVLLAKVLNAVIKNQAFTQSDLGDVCAALKSSSLRESTEAGVAAIAEASVAALPATAQLVLVGLGDKRPVVCREWACAVAKTALPNQYSAELEAAMLKIVKSVEENLAAAYTSKTAAAGYAGLAFLAQKLPELASSGLLIDEKYAGRPSTSQELVFAAMAVSKLPSAKAAPLTVHIVTSARDAESKHQTLAALQVMWRAECDSIAQVFAREIKPDFSAATTALKSLCTRPSSNANEALKQLLLPAHAANVPWTAICIGAGVDPGQLASDNASELVSKVWQAICSELAQSALKSAATLAFVSPEKCALALAQLLDAELQPLDFSSDDIIILSTPKDQLAPTAEVKKRLQGDDNKGKKGDWESELRRELAAKAAKAGKLSAADKEILKAQNEIRDVLDLKVQTRTAVNSLVSSLSKQAAATTVDTGAKFWFPAAVTGLIRSGKGGYDTSSCVSTLVELSQNVSARFEDAKPLVGRALVAQLRLAPQNTELVSRVLLNTKFLGDSRPLDPVTVVYLLPLLRSVIDTSTGDLNEDQEEQLMLALGCLAGAAEALSEIARGSLIAALLSLLEAHPVMAKEIKATLQRLAQSCVFEDSELDAILHAVVSPRGFVRSTALEVLDAEVDLSTRQFAAEIWVARFADDNDAAQLASDIWDESSMSLPDECSQWEAAIEQFSGSQGGVSDQAARAMAAAAKHAKSTAGTAAFLIKMFKVALEPPKPVYNEFGIEMKIKHEDPWPRRRGILSALTEMVPLFDQNDVLSSLEFISDVALSDPASAVSETAQNLGLALIDNNVELLEQILPLLENRVTEHLNAAAPVALYGAAARHLTPGDERLDTIFNRLLASLQKSDKEPVQLAIAGALAVLAPRVADAHPHLDQLLDELLQSEESREIRAGLAHGIAGLCQGLGLVALADCDVSRAITHAAGEKVPFIRESAQLLIASLSTFFGKIYEPYGLDIMPLVFAGLGDAHVQVREAAAAAAKNIMKNTTTFGIGKQIPMALAKLDDVAWRGKKAAVELLGSMAYLDPAQLSSSLSTIVPEIVNALNDTHKEVRNSAKTSLKSFGEVITNPEIRALVPVLLDGISDPTKHTERVLDALLATKFVHFIDSPSLALVIHVVRRGLRDRSANIKRKACQVVGNMSILVDANDLVPYLPEIMPDLQIALTDPVAQTSAIASKALGVLIEKLGESSFPEVIPNLLDCLEDETRVGDRWGCAQGLSEVIYGLGLPKLDEMLPGIVRQCYSPKPWVRQSYSLLLLFLPSSFGASLTPYLAQLTPALLHGLADTSPEVRDTCLKAGRRIVRNYAAKSVDLLLPDFERGLFDGRWRIRHSSVQLTGDLMFQIAGLTSTAPGTEPQSTARAAAALVESLGAERRDRLLAAMFIARADIAADVRTAATDIWMSLVANTPRMVKEILPTLVSLVVRRLTDSEDDIRTISGRALEELVRRISGAELSQMLPILEQLRTDPEMREGVLIAVTQLVKISSTDSVRDAEHTLTALVRESLTDRLDSVREAASRAFDALHEAVGDATGELLPELIAQMQSGDDGAVAALKEMLATSPESVLSALLPALLSPAENTETIGHLADVAEIAGTREIHRYVEKITDYLVTGVTNHIEGSEEALTRVLLVDLPHVHLLQIVKADTPARRTAVYNGVAAAFETNPSECLDFTFVPDWISSGILSLEDQNVDAVKAAWKLCRAISSQSSKDVLLQLVEPAAAALKLTSSPLPGFSLPQGVQCVLPIFLQGILAGSGKQRELAALALSNLVERASSADLKPYVTQITGPLIRVVGEKYSTDIKAAIMHTLNALLQKIPDQLKPFLPQLQRTFVKSLADPSGALLRTRAAKALGTLISLQTRLDPLAKEVVAGAKAVADDPASGGIARAMLQALYEIVGPAGGSLGEPVIQSVYELIDTELKRPNLQSDQSRLELTAKVTAVTISTRTQDTSSLLKRWTDRGLPILAQLAVANALLAVAADAVVRANQTTRILNIFQAGASAETADISEASVRGLAKVLLCSELNCTDEQLDSSAAALISCVPKSASRSQDTRRLALLAIRAVCKSNRHVINEHRDSLILPLFSAVRDTTISVKLAAEKAFLELFEFVERNDQKYFDAYFEEAVKRGVFSAAQQEQRSLPEYVRRVAMRHAAARREQIAGGVDTGDAEDEAELWAICIPSSSGTI